jgi:hypothetical protein
MKTTTRRQTLTGIATTATAALSGLPATAASIDDPVFAAIERHRRATKAWQQHNEAHPEVKLTEAEIERDDAIIAELMKDEYDARVAWAETRPTTIAGIIASLEYAAMEGVYGLDTTPLFESDGDPFHHFPRMIAAALRRLM